MPELTRDLSANRSTALELREERHLVREGYEFLDEKRMLLAAEILRGLQRYQVARAAWLALHGRARTMLLDATARHGLDGLLAYPALEPVKLGIAQHARRAMGVVIVDAQADFTSAPPAVAAVDPSPEARACAASHFELLREAAPLAALERSLRRLAAEYRRTERRARALENVLMPELEQALQYVEEQLELYELEENVRVHDASAEPKE